MALRFRRTIRVLPGIRLNLSRSGISTSVGVRGAHVTVGLGRVRATVGLPGSGLSYSESQALGENAVEPPQKPRGGRGFWWWLGMAALALFLLPVIVGLAGVVWRNL